MVGTLRHSQRKRRETDMLSLSPRRHSLTLPQFFLSPVAAIRKRDNSFVNPKNIIVLSSTKLDLVVS